MTSFIYHCYPIGLIDVPNIITDKVIDGTFLLCHFAVQFISEFQIASIPAINIIFLLICFMASLFTAYKSYNFERLNFVGILPIPHYFFCDKILHLTGLPISWSKNETIMHKARQDRHHRQFLEGKAYYFNLDLRTKNKISVKKLDEISKPLLISHFCSFNSETEILQVFKVIHINVG